MNTFRLFIYVIVLNFYSNWVLSQCTFTGPEIIAPNTSRTFNLDISGVNNDDLSDPMQGVCAVILDFQHPLIGDLTIKLRSPSNQEITLVGPIGITNFTNNSRWNVAFYPCGFQVDPDPGFLSTWSNIQNWGQFGYFEGSYYPSDNCLEDFNNGPVNGIWQIEFINQYPFDVPVNSAILHDFSILFCDPGSLDCKICLAKGGNLIAPSGAFCQGDDQLLLDVNKQISGIQPDPDFFGYKYLIGQAGTLKAIQDIADLRTFEPGQYTVCGLSYLLEDTLLLPDPLISNDISIGQLRSDLRSNMPPFCGSVSGECLDIEILANPVPDSLYLLLCDGDTIFYEVDTLILPGEYIYTYPSNNGCDSIVFVFIETPQIEIKLSPLTPLSCGDSIHVWITDVQSSLDFDKIDTTWILPNGNEIKTDTLLTFLPGKYQVQLGFTFGNKFCVYVFEFNIIATYAPSTFELSYEASVCQGSHLSINILNPESPPITWSLSDPNLSYTISDDAKSIIVEFLEPGDFEVCMTAFDSCTQSFTDSCIMLNVLPLVYPEIAFDSLYCSLKGEFYLSGFENDILITQLEGPGTFELYVESLDYIEFEVSKSGNYWFRLSSPFENCNLFFDQWVTFLPEPIPFSIDYSLAICEPNPLLINLEFVSDEVMVVTLSMGGQLQDIELSNSNIRTISIPYDEVVLPVSLMGYRYLNYPDCQLEDDYPLELEFVKAPEISVPDTVKVCNAPDSNQPSTVNFNDFFGNYFDNVVLTNSDGVGIGDFDDFSFENVVPGFYHFDYVLDYHFSCNPLTGSIVIEVLPCACPDLLNTFSIEICNDLNLDLTQFETIKQGRWSIIESPQNNTAQIVNNSINWNNQPAGTYTLEYFVDVVIGNCPQKDTFNINLIKRFEAGSLTQDSIIICVELDTLFNLFDYLNGSDIGVWQSIPDPRLTPSVWDSSAGLLKTQSLSAGIYSFTYKAEPGFSCPGDSLIMVVAIENKKFENLVADVSFGCNTPYAEFNISLDTNFFTVFWEVLEGDFNIQDPNLPKIIIDEEGKFVLQVLEKRNGCLTKEFFTVSKIEDVITDFDVIVNNPVCPEEFSGSIIITNVIGGIGPFDYGVNGQFSRNNSINNLNIGAYTIEVVDSRGCRLSKSVLIESPGILSAKILGDSLFRPGDLATFTSEVTNLGYSINTSQWFFDNLMICDDCTDVQFSITKSGILRFQLVTNEGCILMVEKYIYLDNNILIFIPDIFTPNRDGINDVFTFYSPESALWIHQFSVFDKWGNEIYQVKNIDLSAFDGGWDGTYKNLDMGPGTFIYMLRIQRPNEDMKIYKGEILLAR